MTIVPSIKRDYIAKIAEEGKRIDGRGFDQYRKIEIETNVVNKAEGSARVKIGNTQVLCGIKMDIGTPFPDTPASGVMSTAAEFVPLASPDFESGPPREDAIELARVVDRGVRESQVIQIEKLCIAPGEKGSSGAMQGSLRAGASPSEYPFLRLSLRQRRSHRQVSQDPQRLPVRRGKWGADLSSHP